MQEKIQNLWGARLLPRDMIYTWWIRPRRRTTTIRKIKPTGKSQNDGADAAQSLAAVKNSDKSARRIDTPVNSEGNNDHMDPAMEQDEPGHAEHSSEQTPDHNDPEGRVH